MTDHTGHTPNQPAKPEPATKNTPAAKPDPHAGHDMGKMGKAGTPPKGAEKQ
ncbi:MAG: hypothetical protein ABJD11_16690 [Gemmatimonadota bacterium]